MDEILWPEFQKINAELQAYNVLALTLKGLRPAYKK